ncbi:hypothetical protein B0T18DRAFT_326855 [Schizothecium vesticola]|uniref:Rhodopsin domain-containing protein n=1 Tax=Schizothecium vesticola TaxID=314040 RepID=A0AA40K5U0_9PEZI|nr:hypothetical protein B0T18DRAFT_326855 [Schizothecium vesticola]
MAPTATHAPGYAKENNANMALLPCVILTPLMVLTVAIRVWARHTMTGLGLEDWMLLLGFLFAIITNTIFLLILQYGYGYHTDVLSDDNLILVLRTWWVAQMTYKISLQATKVSLLLFYMRIFHHIAWFKKISLSLIAFLIIYLIATTVTSIVQCTPVALAWDASVDGHCIDLPKFFIFNGVVALLTDLLVLVLPLPLVWGLQLPFSQKLALIPVFGIGIAIVVVSALRLKYLITAPALDKTYDLEITLWTIIEYNLALVCASLPSVRVLLARMFPRFLRGSSAARYRSDEAHSAAAIGGGGLHGSSWGKGGSGAAGWSRVHSPAVVAMKSGKGGRLGRTAEDSSSEDIILEPHHGGIQKTVQYDVQYGAR